MERLEMIYNLYLYVLHWLMDSLPKVDDTHIKCAQCGWESGAMRNIKFLYSGYGYVVGHCPECFGDSIYFKKDWSDLKAAPIDLKINIIEKDLDMQMIDSGKKVGNLLNDDEVVVIITDGAYKGGHTTKVRYELADFMDDEPPFMEILFVDKYDDVVYFTENMNQPVYELNGVYIVEGENK